jgi:ankyrin repeat protein
LRVPRKSNDTSNGAMETRSERRKTEPIVEKIRRGEVSVFVAVAEELPEVFRTHVVRKLGLLETLILAQVNKSYNAAVWSVEAVRSLDEKAEDFARLHNITSVPSLHVCSASNNVKAIKALISSGADLEERSREKAKPSRYGRVTALHFAASHSNNFDAMKLLLEAGADVNARTQLPKPNDGATPLCFAVHSLAASASSKLVPLLLEAGADVNLKVALDDRDGFGLNFDTVLGYYTRAIHANAEVVKMLLDAGADPNGQDTLFDQTPLHNVPLLYGYEGGKIGKLLLEHGADPLLTDRDGNTPLELAKELSTDQDLIDLLTEATKKALKSRA